MQEPLLSTSRSRRAGQPAADRSPSEFTLRRRREEARTQFQTHRRHLANGVLWPAWFGLFFLSVFALLTPLIGIRWVPQFGHIALIATALFVFLTREMRLTLAAAGRVTRLDAELALLRRAERRRTAAISRDEGERSGEQFPIPAEASTVNLPRPASAASPGEECLPRVAGPATAPNLIRKP